MANGATGEGGEAPFHVVEPDPCQEQYDEYVRARDRAEALGKSLKQDFPDAYERYFPSDDSPPRDESGLERIFTNSDIQDFSPEFLAAVEAWRAALGDRYDAEKALDACRKAQPAPAAAPAGPPTATDAPDVVTFGDDLEQQEQPRPAVVGDGRAKKPVLIGVGVLVLAGAGIGAFFATSGGGGPSLPATSLAGAATTTAAVPAAPVLAPLVAVFNSDAYSTYYIEHVQGAPGATYTWSVAMSADTPCQQGFKGNTPSDNEATWFHADVTGTPSGPCNHAFYGAQGHPGTVTVVVTTSHWICTASYVGTISGTGPAPAPCRRT